MNIITRVLGTALLFAVTAVGVTLVTPATVSAEEQKTNTTTSGEKKNQATETKTEAKADANAKEETKDVNYVYVAQAGDSYSKMARKAVQTYGLKYKKNTTAAGIVFAETNLTQLAGSPLLDEGETVTFAESTVKEWFEKSLELTDAQIDAWNYYVPWVEFNTNNIGE